MVPLLNKLVPKSSIDCQNLQEPLECNSNMDTKYHFNGALVQTTATWKWKQSWAEHYIKVVIWQFPLVFWNCGHILYQWGMWTMSSQKKENKKKKSTNVLAYFNGTIYMLTDIWDVPTVYQKIWGGPKYPSWGSNGGMKVCGHAITFISLLHES